MTSFVSLDGSRLVTGKGTATWIAERRAPLPLLSITDARTPGPTPALFDAGEPDPRPLEPTGAGLLSEAKP